ncbi:MAG: DUF151 domain-containing protein [Prevotellaceae bacterium]|nr:DUF151 domain-containing protein [Prevotellaceae bacterium]MDY3857041.1 bifunctional nuclease domain-containing protein [Bacteroidaceae bacterium]
MSIDSRQEIYEFQVKAITSGTRLGDTYLLILQEKGGERIFALPMDAGEAEMMTALLQEHQFTAKRLVEGFKQLLFYTGLVLERVVLSAIENGHYLAYLELNHDGEAIESIIDATAGIMVALETRAPIYVANTLISPDAEAGRGTYMLPVGALSLHVLREALNDAIDNEQYEIAEMLRNEIKRRS